ncbi:MAG: hypothetical protein V4553_01335 [Bacteroidota bacterium]
MKKLITLIACFGTLFANAQQKMNVFYVVDSLSGKPIPSTTVTIVRAKLSITTEKDGIFKIPGDLSAMRDTVILNTQTYIPFKIPLDMLSDMDTIRLTRYGTEIKNEKIKYKDDTLLNDYKKRDVVHYAGVNTETANFEYLQLAQQYYTNRPGIFLKEITLNRLAFGPDDSDHTWTGLVFLDRTKFRIRIYDIDPVTHGPGRDLCTRIIEEKKSMGSQVSVNLKKYNIIIPNTSFFVAVEWLRDFYNAGYSTAYDSKQKKMVRQPNYHPAIGISATTGERLNIWALNFKHEWKPYGYFMPFGTDLAMSAVIKY